MRILTTGVICSFFLLGFIQIVCANAPKARKSVPVSRWRLPPEEKMTSRSLSKTKPDLSKKLRQSQYAASNRKHSMNNNNFGYRARKTKMNSLVREEDEEDIGKSIAAYLESFAVQGKGALKSIIRSVKVIKSSSFESLLLRATWPDDGPVPQVSLDQILLESLPAFDRYMQLYGQTTTFPPTSVSGEGYSGCDDPYFMTNHKLYMKMVEDDWRTTLKSLHIFHSIFKQSSPSTCKSFRGAMIKMKQQKALKHQADHFNYFDEVMIAHTNTERKEISLFLDRCTKFILHRVRHFSGEFTELQASLAELDKASSVAALQQPLKILKAAQQNLALGLHCKLSEDFAEKPVAVQTYRLIASDVLNNWLLFTRHISTLVRSPATLSLLQAEGSSGDETVLKKAATARRSLAALVQFYIRTSEQISTFLKTDRKMQKLYRGEMKALWRNGEVPRSHELQAIASALLGGTEAPNWSLLEDAAGEATRDSGATVLTPSEEEESAHIDDVVDARENGDGYYEEGWNEHYEEEDDGNDDHDGEDNDGLEDE